MATRYIEIQVEAGKALRQLKNVADATERTAKNTGVMAKSLNQVTLALKGIAVFKVAQGVLDLASAFAEASDAAADVDARLSSIARSTVGASAAFTDLFAITSKNGVAIEGLVSSYTKLGVAVPTAEHEELVQALDTMATTLATTGASTQQVNAVMLQMSQALGSGALQGDEFRSVFENAPVLLRAWQEAAGLTDQSLRELSSSAQLTTESFFKFLPAIQQIATEMIGMTEPPVTLARGLQVLSSGFVTFAGGVAESIPVVSTFGQVMKDLGLAMNDAGLEMGYLSETLENTRVSFDPDAILEFRRRAKETRVEIDELSGSMEELNAQQKERLKRLQAESRHAQLGTPEGRLEEAAEALAYERDLLETALASGHSSDGFFVGYLERRVAAAEKQFETEKKNAERVEALVKAREEELSTIKAIGDLTKEEQREEVALAKDLQGYRDAATKKRLEEETRLYDALSQLQEDHAEQQKQIHEDQLARIDAEADKYQSRFQSAIDAVNDIRSSYEDEQGVGGGTFGDVDYLITKLQAAVERGDLGMAEKLQEEAVAGLEKFAGDADNILSHMQFEGLQARLEKATLGAFTGSANKQIGDSILTTVENGVITGYRNAADQVAAEPIQVQVDASIGYELEWATEEVGGR